jgi:hypothetical protein
MDRYRCESDEDEATIESRGFGLAIPKFVTETRDYARGWVDVVPFYKEYSRCYDDMTGVCVVDGC